MDEIRFLCGCAIPLRSRERVVDEDQVVSEKVIDGRVNKDAEGMLVCGEHGFRRHGWRSLPNYTYVNEQGDTITTNRGDHRFASKSFVEIEKDFLQRNHIVA